MKSFPNYLHHKRLVFVCFLFLTITLLSAARTFGQGSNYTGNGGKHTIQGTIYTPSGKRSSTSMVKVRLENITGGDLTVFASTNGSFAFKNLTPGSYYVVIENFEPFEDVREQAYIDDAGSSSVGLGIALPSAPRVINVPVYLQVKRPKDSEAPPGVVSAELGKAPEQAVDLFNRAKRSANAGNNEKAVTALVQAIEIYPEFGLAYNELGMLYGVSGQRDKAIGAFRSAIKFSSQTLTPRLNLGCALAEMKNNEEAAQTLNEAIKLDATSIQAFFCMGKAQLNMQNMMYAERAFSRAIELSGGNHSKAHYLLGGVYWSEKKYQQAAEELEKYLKLEPDAKDAEQTRKTISELRNRQN